MMTLDDAIKHAEEVVEEKGNLAKRIRNNMKSEIALSNADECENCAEEHRQLADWLKELKQFKESAIPLDKVKQTREEIDELDGEFLTIYDGTNKLGSGKYVYIDEALKILDKLIESEE